MPQIVCDTDMTALAVESKICDIVGMVSEGMLRSKSGIDQIVISAHLKSCRMNAISSSPIMQVPGLFVRQY
jgi:hypothetical protein